MPIHRTRSTAVWWLAAACLVFAEAALSKTRAECELAYKPQTGQAGKDVIWLPTVDSVVAAMLEMAKTTPQDYVIDLGAGDGKIPIAAAKQFGARSLGIEYNPDMAKLAQCYAEAEGVDDKVKIVQGDIFETDFSRATVLTLYLLPELNLRLRPTILEMRPGTRVVSNSFLMGDWEPDQRVERESRMAYLWFVPAKAEGTWRFQEQGGAEVFSLQLGQKFQQLSGEVRADRKVTSAAGSLRGDEISLSFGERTLTGVVRDGQIVATVNDGRSTKRYIGTRA